MREYRAPCCCCGSQQGGNRTRRRDDGLEQQPEPGSGRELDNEGQEGLDHGVARAVAGRDRRARESARYQRHEGFRDGLVPPRGLAVHAVQGRHDHDYHGWEPLIESLSVCFAEGLIPRVRAVWVGRGEMLRIVRKWDGGTRHVMRISSTSTACWDELAVLGYC